MRSREKYFIKWITWLDRIQDNDLRNLARKTFSKSEEADDDKQIEQFRRTEYEEVVQLLKIIDRKLRESGS